MTTEMFSEVSEKSRKLMDQTAKLNQMVVEKFEKAADLQMQALRSYADLAMRQAREASSIRDVDSLKSFAESQSEAFREVGERLTSDWRAMQDLASEMREDLQGLFRETGPESAQPDGKAPAPAPKAATPAARPAPKKPARPAAKKQPPKSKATAAKPVSAGTASKSDTTTAS